MPPAVLTTTAVLSLAIALSCLALPLRSLRLRERRCPRCGSQSSPRRIPRGLVDRVISLFVGCRRYKCASCLWSGLIRDSATKPTGEPATLSDLEIPVMPELPPTPDH